MVLLDLLKDLSRCLIVRGTACLVCVGWTLGRVIVTVIVTVTGLVCENRACVLEETCSANDALSHHGLVPVVCLVSRIDHDDACGTDLPPTRNDFDGVDGVIGACHVCHVCRACHACRGRLVFFHALDCGCDDRQCAVVVVLAPSPPVLLCASTRHCGYLFRG